MTSVDGCTVVTRAYLADARLVARSWLDHHPGSAFTILVVDPESGPAPRWVLRDTTVVGPGDVGLAGDVLLTMAAMYTPGEFACALKPWVLAHVLDRADVAIYLDADVEVLAPMDDLAGPARRTGVVLFPHVLTPMPRDGRLPGETTLLAAGMYNAGLLAVGARGRTFLEWWAERLRRDCVTRPDEGFHGDQRWLDFVPSLFDHHIERDPTYDVAYWNLHERPTTWVDGALHVFDRPVRCFHYSGLVDQVPWRLSTFTHAQPRADLASLPAVARKCREWIGRRRAMGVATDRALPYRYATSSGGTALDHHSRAIWRDALIAADLDETGSTAPPPSPFAADQGAAWRAWLNEPAELGVSRYLAHLWSGSDELRTRFPALAGTDRESFLRWARDHSGREAGVPISFRPDIEETPVADEVPSSRSDPRRSDPASPADPATDSPPRDLDGLDDARQALADEPRSLIGHLRRRWGGAARSAPATEATRALILAIDDLSGRMRALDRRVTETRARVEATDATADIVERTLAEGRDAARRHASEMTERLAAVEAELVSVREALAGALEEERITGAILADAERCLEDDLRSLRRTVAKLTDAATDDATDDHDNAADTREADDDRPAEAGEER